jgi:hypothetical protein
LSDFFAGCQVKSSELRSVTFALDLVPKAIYRLSDIGAMKNKFVPRRAFPFVAIALISSVFYTAVAHACSDLRSMQVRLQPRCNHMPSETEPPLSKKENPNCDYVRYGMLSTQRSPSQTELLTFTVVQHQPIAITVPLHDILTSFWRFQPPPFHQFRLSPQASQVVLRI